MPVSDRFGRAFEYCTTKAIYSRLEELYPGRVRMTHRAKEAQLRNEEQFASLDEELKKQFRETGNKISQWLATNRLKDLSKLKFRKPTDTLSAYLFKGKPGRISKVEVDRIPDVAGVRGDVTDVRIKFFSNGGVATVNISLKHRHEALKHPRLTRVPEWIGLAKTKEAKEYRRAYENIWDIFFERGKELSPSAKRFRELKSIDSNFIEENLYKPLYTLVAEFLKSNIKKSSQVQQMFNFMVGKFDYIKFVEHNGEIAVRDFSDIPSPSSVEVEYGGSGYLYLQFDNGWRISGRLHTATQWLKKSIKFDMQPCNLDSVVPAIYI